MIKPSKLKASFKAAFSGLKTAHTEQTFQIFVFLGILVVILMFVLDMSSWERVVIIFLVTSVMAFELINSQIEKILDFLQPDHDPRVKRIKDISAGAVLLASIGAAIIGLMMFLPHILDILFLKK